jgi:hypothetical protein
MKKLNSNSMSYIKVFLIIAIITLWNTSLFPQITITKVDASCDMASDGSATVNINGGTPPYTIFWSTGSTNQTVNNLSPGNYSVFVSDKNGCSGIQSVEIEALNTLTLTIQGANAEVTFCMQQGPPEITLTAVASGGTPPYSLSWPGGSIKISSSGTYTCSVTDNNLCTASASIYVVFIPIQCAWDPNEILGSNGFGEEQWISVTENLNYTVYFENDPDFATASAQEVNIKVPIDDKANMYSLRIGNFGFGDFVFSVPPNTSFYTQRLNVIDSLGVYVDVIAGLDVNNNEAFWIFKSIDPATGLPPNDPNVGFLPVNDSLTNKGEGFVTFTIQPKSTDVTGDSLNAKAEIIFDINDAIVTNEWFNTIDAVPPASTVNFLPPVINSTSFEITISGQDDPGGCGINTSQLYYSKDAAPYNLFGEYEVGGTAQFIGQENSTYRFFSIAKDNVGNIEPMKVTPDVTTQISLGPIVLDLNLYLEGPYALNQMKSTSDLDLSKLIIPDEFSDDEITDFKDAAKALNLSDVIDILVIELRDAPGSPLTATMETIKWRKLCLLLKNGCVVDVKGDSLIKCGASIIHNLFVVVKHRNHLPVISAFPLQRINGTYPYNFSTSADQAYGGTLAQKELASGIWGMIAGDGDRSGVIDLNDKTNVWSVQAGQNGQFKSGDYNLNGTVDNVDKNDFWLPNIGQGTQVPQ